MSTDTIHGVVEHQGAARKTDYLFRVSIKGLVKNSAGHVLVVKEAGREYWDLPGGGMDHGENIKTAIARELKEEVNLWGDFTYRPIAVEDPVTLEHAKVWQMRIVFHIVPEQLSFEPGEDADEVRFVDPETLKDSSIFAEQKVYDYSLLS